MTLNRPESKDALFEQFARIGKAVSSPRRLELLDLLSQGPRTVERLAELTGQSLANTSHHLKALRAVGLVHGVKQGLYVTCSLASDDVGAFWRALRDLGRSHVAEVSEVTRAFREDRDQLELVAPDVLMARMRRDEVTLLDVRPAEEYASGHIPGAISVPLAELERRLAELPKDREIVAYCRGPFCVMAVKAVRALHAHGWSAAFMEEGVPEWGARGLAVAGGGR